jgi:hypothetical protein
MFNRYYLLLLILFSTYSVNVLAKPFVYLGYGLASYSNEKKSAIDLFIRNTPLKLSLGQRYGHLEFELQYRMASGKTNFTHDNIKNTLTHKSKTILAGFGVYTIPALRLGAGITFHSINEKISTNMSAAQNESIELKYNLQNESGLGTYLCGDLDVIKFGNSKITISSTIFFTPTLGKSKEYEIMAGFKIPFAGGGRSSSFNPLRSMSER